MNVITPTGSAWPCRTSAINLCSSRFLADKKEVTRSRHWDMSKYYYKAARDTQVATVAVARSGRSPGLCPQ